MTDKKGWQPVFLEKYAETGNLSRSAEYADVSRTAVYKAKKQKAFGEQFAAAREEAADGLEAVAFQRARETSDTLLIFLLKGLKPDVYAERTRHGFDQDAPLRIQLKWE